MFLRRFQYRNLSTRLALICVIVFQAIVLYVWWLSVDAEVVSVMESNTGQYSLYLLLDGPIVRYVISSVEGCRVLFAFQQSPQ